MPLSHDDMAFLQYTGGTTGVAKGAVLTHGNLVANVQQMSAWMARDLVDGKEVFVCPLPLYHVYALTSCLVFMKMGAHTVLVTNPRDMKAFIHDLQEVPLHDHHRRQHAVPGAARCAGVRRGRHARPQADQRRRHGGAARGGRALEAAHRRDHHRRLRPDRNLAGRDGQPARHRGVDRHDRPADSVDRGRHPRRRRPRARGRRGRARSACAARRSCRGYWNRPDETEQGLHRRRLAAHRRHGVRWTSAATSGSRTARRT